jgi:tripartite-type tricarboxylate transporter receptor subunit TctC
MLKRSLLAAAVALVTSGIVARSWSQPAGPGPVTLIVPYAPGGSADIYARMLAGPLGERLHQPVKVENMPGGGGAVGLQTASKAAPDGRTLLLGQTGEIVVQPFFLRQTGPRPAPVSLVAVIPLAVVVAKDAPWQRVADLRSAAVTTPRGISVASPGRLTPGDLAIELFRARTGGRLATVPFEGGGPALDAVANGQIDLYFSTLPSAMPYLREGKVKILAVTSSERSPALPDVPTMQESGIRNFAVSQWAGVFVPRDTPAATVGTLNGEINQILARPEIAKAITDSGGKVMPLSPAQFADFIQGDAKIYRELLTAELCSEFVVESCSGGGIFAQ